MQIGQKLWYVPPMRGGAPHEVTVTKIGRVWGYFDGSYSGSRFDLKTLTIDSQYSSGKLYLTREQHDREVALNRAWREFVKEVNNRYTVPPGATINQIDNAMRSLFKRSALQANAGES
jgi:hypothetical protein